MRVLCYLSPAFNVAMGLTEIRFRDYLIGSAITLVPMTSAVVLLIDELIALGWL